jgi:hypothetical protein
MWRHWLLEERRGALLPQPLVSSIGELPMSRPDPDPDHCAAARALWRLLCDDGPYREAWKLVARKERLRVTNGKVSVEAVRRLVLDWLWEHGELKTDPRSLETQQQRPWKDRIYAVANGRRLSTHTLDTFIEAFDISDDDAARLRALHEGDRRDDD